MRVLGAALCLSMMGLSVLGLSMLVVTARAEDESPAPEQPKVSFQDLDPKVQKELATAARAYFDPTVEFLWKPRKDLKAAFEEVKASAGADVLANIPLLRKIVYQGRHFLARYDDEKWQREEEISDFEKDGIYLNVKSEKWRFTYTVPGDYPKERGFEQIPRKNPPLPLLLSIHEERDVEDARQRAEKYPGGAVLKRRYPEGDFDALYDNWLVLAPVAARGKFLEDGGGIRHRFLTGVLTEFWRHYHVDYDRIVVDGGAPAAALAAAFPHVFAGLVLRGNPTLDLDLVRNYAGVPVFVMGEEGCALQLEHYGHPDVTVGDDQTLLAWLDRRRRTTATRFSWRCKNADHRWARWIFVAAVDTRWSDPSMDVRIVDTAIDPNTIWIEARGIEKIHLYLNDEVIDLDRPVRLVINGRERLQQHLERDFERLFDKVPYVRRNMNFGWLYTVLLEDIPIAAQDAGPSVVLGDEVRAGKLWARAEAAAKEGNEVKARLYYQKVVDQGETSYRDRALGRLGATPPVPTADDGEAAPDDPGLPHDIRLAAQREWLEGRPDRLERHLGPALETRTAEAALPFALRDRWWRRTGDDALRAHLQDLEWSGLVADQLLWILGGGVGPYPTATEGDPWPILTALVRERQQRETTGTRWLPDESPVLRRRLPELPAEWQDWYARWCTWFYEDWMRPAYEGKDPATFDGDYREELAAQDRTAADARSRNLWLALITGLLFVGGAFVAGRRLSRD